MNANPWVKYPLMVVALAMIGYGLFSLLSGLAFGTIYDRLAIVTLLVAWAAAYLIWGRKLGTWFRNSN